MHRDFSCGSGALLSRSVTGVFMFLKRGFSLSLSLSEAEKEGGRCPSHLTSSFSAVSFCKAALMAGDLHLEYGDFPAWDGVGRGRKRMWRGGREMGAFYDGTALRPLFLPLLFLSLRKGKRRQT